MKKSFLLLYLLSLISVNLCGQSAILKGRITDSLSTEPIPFASVYIELEGIFVDGITSDFEGNYIFKSLPPGKYNLIVSYVGYYTKIKKDVEIYIDSTRIVNISLGTSAELLDAFEVVAYKVPLISKDMTCTGSTVTAEEIRKTPCRSSSCVTSVIGGVVSYKSKGQVRGSRTDRNAYFIDGVRISGNSDLPGYTIGNLNPNIKSAKGRKIKKKNKHLVDVPSGMFDGEEYARIIENKFESPLSQPLSTFSIDVDKASYANIRRFVNNSMLPDPNAVRIEELINYFSYDYEAPDDEHPFSINMEMGTCPWNPNHNLLMLGIKGKEIKRELAPPANLVFLIDVSGSMDCQNKLPLLKKAFKMLVNELRDDDLVSVVVYAGAAGQVLPPTRGKHWNKILDAINMLEAGGSTAGGEGIKLAYSVAKKNFVHHGNNRIILATDGDFNVGVSSDDALVNQIESMRDQGIYLTVLGFGIGNYKDSKMEKITNAGNGNYFYIDNIMEAEKVFRKELMGTILTIAKDVKIQVEFNPEHVMAYRLIGYENRMLETKDFNDDKRDAGEIGSGHSVTVLYEIIPGITDETVRISDPLKYQRTVLNSSNEIMTVKLRYKKPDDNKSTLITKSLAKDEIIDATPSNNFYFISAVAEFGMLLRNSAFKGKADYGKVISRAKANLGDDPYDYRKEFVQIVRKTELIAESELTSK